MRTLSIVSVVVLVAVGLAACGGGGKDDSKAYSDAYKPLNAKLLAVGKEVAVVVNNVSAKRKTKPFAKIDLQAQTAAGNLGNLQDEMKALKPPSDRKADLALLIGRIGAVRESLKVMGTVARAHDSKALTARTRKMLTQAVSLNTAQNRVAQQTGASVGTQ